ncbi:unnamed protein product, partial [Prorocentrum cordatum]
SRTAHLPLETPSPRRALPGVARAGGGRHLPTRLAMGCSGGKAAAVVDVCPPDSDSSDGESDAGCEGSPWLVRPSPRRTPRGSEVTEVVPWMQQQQQAVGLVRL